jgi:hypothetical protein
MSMSRSDAASVAANTRWAFEPDRRKATAAATAGFLAKFEKQVDPDGLLPPEERTKRAHNLMRAHMARIRSQRRRPRSKSPN